jgi:molybdenum cofactor cytidylyltransferase
MGRPKAFLPCGPAPADTFLRRIVRSLEAAGITDVLVVGRPDDEELSAEVGRLASARFLPNPEHARGQLTSIVAAVNAVDHPGVRGLLIIPVDMPLVMAESFAAVLRAFDAHPRAIVRAAFAGRHGHPVVFDRSSFDALRRADASVGAKAVLRENPSRVVDVEVPDSGTVTDIDSVEDYRAVFGALPAAPAAPVP